MTKEILKEEILKEEQLENIAGGVRIRLPREILLKQNENNFVQANVIGDFIPPARVVAFGF